MTDSEWPATTSYESLPVVPALLGNETVGMAMMSDIPVLKGRAGLVNPSWLCTYDLNEVQGSIRVSFTLIFTNDQYCLKLYSTKHHSYLTLSNRDCTDT